MLVITSKVAYGQQVMGVTSDGVEYDGTELPIADILKITERNGSVVIQWRYSISAGNQFINVARGNGTLANCTGTVEGGCRPVFTLLASFAVDDDGIV